MSTPEQIRIHKLIIDLMRIYFALPNPKRMREEVAKTRENLDRFLADFDSGELFQKVERAVSLPMDWVAKNVQREYTHAELQAAAKEDLKMIDRIYRKNNGNIDLAAPASTPSVPVKRKPLVKRKVNPLYPTRR